MMQGIREKFSDWDDPSRSGYAGHVYSSKTLEEFAFDIFERARSCVMCLEGTVYMRELMREMRHVCAHRCVHGFVHGYVHVCARFNG